MEALSYNPEGSSFSYGTQSQALVPYSAPHTSTHYEPSLSYVTTAHQMLPQQLSSHYDSSMPPPPPPPPLPTRKRPRSGSIDDSERHWDRDIRMQQLYPAFSNERSVTLPELPGILYSGHSDYAPSHSTPGPELPPRMNLPRPQQHHHHYLPPQTLLHPDPHGLRPDTHYESSEHANIVDQPGMPAPTPKPTKPKTLFTPEENKKIKYLKEVKRLTWPQIMQFFPGRSTGTLQVRYSKRLKDRDVNWTDRLVSILVMCSSITLIWDRSNAFGARWTSTTRTSGTSFPGSLGTISPPTYAR